MGYAMPDITSPNRPEVDMNELSRGGRQLTPPASSIGGHSSTVEPQNQSSRLTASSHSDEAEASMIKDTSGHKHYIGPSGTLNFLNQLRHLVDSNNAPGGSATTKPEGAAKFTGDDIAQALEADDAEEQQPEQTDPATADSIQTDGVSPDSITSAIARDFARFPIADMEEIVRLLPPNDILELLIHSYFKNVHDDFPLFHRATFEDEYELFVVRTRRNPHLARTRPRPDWGWIGCLYMVIVFGSITNRNIPNLDHAQLRRTSVSMARSLLPQFISKCSLTNVRVLLLLALFLHNNNERNAAWNLVGTATRISFALGLHRSDMASSFRPLEREIRRLVFCTLYSFDQFLELSLGRPSGIHETDAEIIAPREGFLDGSGGTDAKLLSWSLKLQAILGRTRLMYVGRSQRASSSIPTVEEVLTTLRNWKLEISQVPGFDVPLVRLPGVEEVAHGTGALDLEDLKASLAWKTRSQLRAVLLLHIQFHYIAIVATRSILLRNVSMMRKASSQAASYKLERLSPHAAVCVNHASQLCYLILLLDHFEVLNGLTGLDIFYCYCAAMILILRLLPPPRQNLEEPGVGTEELHTHLFSLVSTVRDVINGTDKSGSMKRFARVVDTFAGCVNLEKRQEFPGNYITALQAGPQQYGTPSSSINPNMAGSMDEVSLQNFGNPSGMLDLFPFMTFGEDAMGMNMPVPGDEEMPISEWSNMQLFLAGYGDPASS
jgi:hypothetical protein